MKKIKGLCSLSLVAVMMVLLLCSCIPTLPSTYDGTYKLKEGTARISVSTGSTVKLTFDSSYKFAYKDGKDTKYATIPVGTEELLHPTEYDKYCGKTRYVDEGDVGGYHLIYYFYEANNDKRTPAIELHIQKDGSNADITPATYWYMQ